MYIEKGAFFKGIINDKIVQIVNASDYAVTFRDVERNTIHTVGRTMFEHLLIEPA